MIRLSLIMLLNVCLWARDEYPTGSFIHNHGGGGAPWWCIRMNWGNYKSQHNVSITAVCGKPPHSDSTLQLDKVKESYYEVTAKGEEEYEEFIDWAMSECPSIGLRKDQTPKDLFTFGYDADYNMLVTSINSKPVTMVPGDCGIP